MFVHTTSQLPIQHWLTANVTYLANSQKGSNNYFPNEIADYIFDQERRKLMRTSNLTSNKTKLEHMT